MPGHIRVEAPWAFRTGLRLLPSTDTIRKYGDTFGQPGSVVTSGQLAPPGSSDSGLFWLCSANNWEMLVKVLKACSVNDRLWIFAEAGNNVQHTLTVRNTFTNQNLTFSNPQGNLARTITETQTLACETLTP